MGKKVLNKVSIERQYIVIAFHDYFLSFLPNLRSALTALI